MSANKPDVNKPVTAKKDSSKKDLAKNAVKGGAKSSAAPRTGNSNSQPDNSQINSSRTKAASSGKLNSSQINIETINQADESSAAASENIKSADGVVKRRYYGKPGPFQIVESEIHGYLENPLNAPRRRYECPNYETCLVIAAGLDWDSFTCRGCNGEYQQSLYWRAGQEISKDKTVKSICELPKVVVTKDCESTKNFNGKLEGDETVRLKVVGKA